jgi:AFG3 family protein
LEKNIKVDYNCFTIWKGFLIFMLKRSSEMMGGAAGRGKGRGGGLFGGVMESTAKLINPTDIKVQFK